MTNFQIKLIAILTMLIDHIGMVFHTQYTDLFMLRQIGRISFPLFAFLAAEACIHTKDIKKYMGRLLMFAFISQIPFALVSGIDIFERLNIFFTLFTGVFFVHLYKISLSTKSLVTIVFFKVLFIFGYIIADSNHFDYGGLGVLLIVLLYIARSLGSKNKRIYTALAIFAIVTSLYVHTFTERPAVLVWAISSIIPIYFYNGEIGTNSKFTKWIFYMFYPIHLIALFFIRFIIL